MSETKKYVTKLIKCPRCFRLIELKGYSKTSINCAMEDLYIKVEYHLNNTCFFRYSKHEKTKVPVSVSVSTETENKLKTEWEDNHFFLL